jgi:hypothetical protein
VQAEKFQFETLRQAISKHSLSLRWSVLHVPKYGYSSAIPTPHHQRSTTHHGLAGAAPEALDACADLQHTPIEALNVIKGAISSDLQASVRSRHAHVFMC